MKIKTDKMGSSSFGIVNSNRDIDVMIAKSKRGQYVFKSIGSQLGERASKTPKGFKRCPGCGGMVKLPCVYCEALNALRLPGE